MRIRLQTQNFFVALFILFLSASPYSASAEDAKGTTKPYAIHAGVLCLEMLYGELEQLLEKCPAISGVVRNDEEAYFWLSLVTSPNKTLAEGYLRDIEKRLPDEKISALQKRIKEWTPVASNVKLSKFDKAQSKALAGDAVAAWEVGVYHFHQKNYQDAYFWMTLAQSKASFVSTGGLAPDEESRKHLTTEQIASIQEKVKAWKPMATARQQAIARAERGDAEAQFELANEYDGIDDKEAAKWYRKAAEQGNSVAQYSLGKLYAEGGGEIEDKEMQKLLSGALNKIDDFIVVNSTKPITKEELEKMRQKYAEGAEAPCKVSDTARHMINGMKQIPAEEFNRALDEFLAVPRVPTAEPCF